MIEQNKPTTSYSPPVQPLAMAAKAPVGTVPPTSTASSTSSFAPKQPRKILGIDMRAVMTVLGLTLFFVIAMAGVLIALRQRSAPTEVSAPNAPVSEPQAAGAKSCTFRFTVAPQEQRGCNSECATTAQCSAINAAWVCDQGSEGEGDEFCRLGSNPTSLTCEAAVVTTYQCNSACTTTAQCQTANADFVCDPGTAATDDQFCRLASNPTSATCAAATTYACDSVCTTDAQCSAVDPDFSCETVGTEQRCRLTTEPTAANCQATGGPTYSCNSECTTTAQCQTVDADHVCAATSDGNRCRLGENQTSTTCAAKPPTVGCQQACVSNGDCTDPNHICHSTAKVCRLETNPESTSCQPPAVVEDPANCQEACTANSDCADANHICQSTSDGNVCRLSTNPDSRTCSPSVPNDSNPTVGCQATCTSNASCSDPDHICYNTGSGNVCRLADNPTSTTCSAMPRTTTPAAPAAPAAPVAPGQPELPEELPQSGAGDLLKWIGPGVGAMLIGALVLFFL